MKLVLPGAGALILVLAAGSVMAAAPAAHPTTLSGKLSAAAERPGPGDPKGSGSVVLHVEPQNDRVCYELKVRGLEVTMAHLHQAGPEDSGPPLADLKVPGADGRSAGCFEAGPMMLQGLSTNPGAYYVNVHTAQHPAGALRAQLGPARKR